MRPLKGKPMFKMIMEKDIFIQLLMLFFLFTLLASRCHGGVIFEDNFDSSSDWNTAGQYEGIKGGPKL